MSNFPVELYEELRRYTDKFGCLVMRDVIEHQDEVYEVAGCEDSLHKYGILLSFLGWGWTKEELAGQFPWSCSPYRRFDDGVERVVRHPHSIYTTSRDQVLPAIIGAGASNRKEFLDFLWRYCKTVPVLKDKYKGIEWLIKLFPHTDNGDVFQPHHYGCYLRSLSCFQRLSFWQKTKLWLCDVWFMLGALVSWVNASNASNHIQGWLMIEQSIKTKTQTVPMKIGSFFYNWFVSFDNCFKNYFSPDGNPPLGKLYLEYKKVR